MATYRARRRLVGKLASKHDIVGLQEDCASDAMMLALEMSDRVTNFSHSDASRGGGILILIKKAFIKHFDNVIVQPLAPGRVVRVTLFSPPALC